MEVTKRGKNRKERNHILVNHNTHISANEYRTRAKGTRKQVRDIGRRLGIKVL